ncbi:Protein of unknown function [Lactobacillus helveticus CIRM-BIA 101]|nr:Protein of unknown function [Lactobacillus helveticus CIRM-BIA 101]
MIVFFSDL